MKLVLALAAIAIVGANFADASERPDRERPNVERPMTERQSNR